MMNAKKQLLLLALASAFVVEARERDCRTLQTNLGVTLDYAQYRLGCEPVLRGALAGVHWDMYYIKPSCTFLGLRFDGRWNAGSIGNCDSSSVENKVQDYRTEGYVGYNWMWCDDSMRLTPLVGLGFFYLRLTEDGCFSGSDSALRNQYYNLFVPVGLKYQWMINDCFSWGMEGEYRIDAWSRLTVRGSCSAECDKLKLHPRTSGLLIELPFTWYGKEWCNMDWMVKFVPQFDWNRFGSSDCCPSSSSCSNSCSSTCPSSSCSSTCSSSSAVLCPFDSSDVSGTCCLPRLNQFYVGAHLDFGIKF